MRSRIGKGIKSRIRSRSMRDLTLDLHLTLLLGLNLSPNPAPNPRSVRPLATTLDPPRNHVGPDNLRTDGRGCVDPLAALRAKLDPLLGAWPGSRLCPALARSV